MIFPTKLLLLRVDVTNLQEITDFLKFYLGSSVKIIKILDIYAITYDNISENGLEETLNSFSSDSLISLNLFESETLKNYEDYLRALEFSKLFSRDLTQKVYNTEKDLLNLAVINNLDNKLVYKLAFRNYYNNQDMISVCKAMFKMNLNISRAADYLYIHRNTLKYKLDRFYKDTNFDLRVFSDAALLDAILKK